MQRVQGAGRGRKAALKRRSSRLPQPRRTCADVFLLALGAWCNSRPVLHRVKTSWTTLSGRQRLLLAAAAAATAIASESLADPKGLRRLDRLRADISRQEDNNRELREANAKLRKTIDELSPPVNPAALEKAAREQLGFVRSGEVLFKFE